jgi:hypothetical protein
MMYIVFTFVILCCITLVQPQIYGGVPQSVVCNATQGVSLADGWCVNYNPWAQRPRFLSQFNITFDGFQPLCDGLDPYSDCIGELYLF